MRLLIIILALVVINVGFFVVLEPLSKETIITYGPIADVNDFKMDKVLNDPSLGGELSRVKQFIIGDNSLFLTIISIEAAAIIALLVPGWRMLAPSGFSMTSRPTSTILCIGLGGVGKTTLIRENLMDEPQKPKKTSNFERYSTKRHIDNALTDLYIYDHQGQNFPELMRAALSLESVGHHIDHLVIICSIFKVEEDGANWKLLPLDTFPGSVENTFTEEQAQKISENVLGIYVYNAKGLRRISVLFNHIDMFSDQDDSRFFIENTKMLDSYRNVTDHVTDQVNLLKRGFEEKYNTLQAQKTKFWHRSVSDIELKVDFHYVSTAWGIRLDLDKSRVEPLTHAILRQ